MIETKCNYKGNYDENNLNCEICKMELDTTKHLFKCKGLNYIHTQFKNVNLEEPSSKLAEYTNLLINTRENLGMKIKFCSEDE